MTRLAARGIAVAPPGAEAAVLRDFSVEIAAGEWVAITGPNGCGKSTLAMALAGLWPLSEGKLSFDGAPFGPGPSGLRRRVAVVFQDPSSQLLQPTVAEELRFGARNLDLEPGRIERSAARWGHRLGVDPAGTEDPRTLSAGRQQALLIAAAFCQEPDLLVADEASAHLDAEARAGLNGLLAERAREGMTIVWVTQEEEECRAAGRTIRLGAAPAGTPRPSPAVLPEAEEEAPLLEVSIGPTPGEGPRVRMPWLDGLRIPRRGVVAITGPNGCGKSVLLASMAGVEAPAQIGIRAARKLEPAPIFATQFPESQIFEERVADELAYGPRQRGTPEPEIQLAISQRLASVVDDPAAFAQRRCWALSAGEKRLVGVIGALLTPASLVLLDEPTAGLDPRVKAGLAEQIRRRARRDPVVVASQDPVWVEGLGGVRLGPGQTGRTTPSRRQKTD